ncbi:MAG: TolC family protein [Hyphomicrobiaceae bacterium]|nr:TolC family protein [Hyphomicrobiaceae bacterium]
MAGFTFFDRQAALAIDLSEALRRALAADPRLAAGRVEVQAAQGGVLQAGKRPNPELSVDVDDFLGSGDYRGFDKATLTVSLQQKFERGDKRDARVATAIGKEDVANAEIAVSMREIVAQTKVDYVQVLGAQQRIDLFGRVTKRLEDLVPLLKRRVDAGASPPADMARGELAVGRARVAVDKARSELQSAKRQLVSNWSGAVSDAAVINGRLRHNGHQLAPLQAILSNIDENPSVRAWSAVFAQREGELRLQRATAAPDLTASVGVKRIFESNDTAFRIGGSIPLPVHDRNEGSIIEAERRLAKVEFDRDTTRRQIKRRIIDAFGEFDTACVEARKLAEIIPIAKKASDNVQTSFDQGRLGVKDLLDAHRDQLEAEIQQLDADIRCHTGAAKLETLSNRKSFQHGWETVTRRPANE